MVGWQTEHGFGTFTGDDVPCSLVPDPPPNVSCLKDETEFLFVFLQRFFSLFSLGYVDVIPNMRSGCPLGE